MTLLAALVETSGCVTATSSRLAKIGLIAGLLADIGPGEVGIAVGWLAGDAGASGKRIGWSLIRETRNEVAALTPTLTLSAADAALAAIARQSGRGSTAKRREELGSLFALATADEQAFLARLLLGELRQGALEGLMIEAVAVAAGLPLVEVRRAAMVGGGIGAVAAVALGEGLAGLRGFAIAVMQPVAPMLSQPADDIGDALARVSPAALEWKLDGARVQVHKAGAEVRAFSRTGNDVTDALPEIVEAARALDAEVLILDGEAIALRSDGSPHPFQDTMRRFGRVLEVDAMRSTLPLAVYFFDCLRIDAEDLLGATGDTRFDRLSKALPASLVIPRLITDDPAAAQAFYDDAIRRGHEGVMVKALDAAYDPGARSAAWLKVKRAHTLDLVVLAAEWGNGRRSGWLSNLHLGARDAETGEFVMLGKTFKGMTDAMLASQTEALLARERGRDGSVVHVRPELVVEIMFNDLQASPRYPAGLALRFARVKGYRPDKRAEEADTMDAVRAIYAAQGAAADHA